VTATTWTKFFWADWESDEALKLCSPGAQALWMRMLCVCAKSDGFLVISGEKLGASDMAKLTGWPVQDVRKWWEELKRWGVFSVEGRGKIYCRRMVRDAKRAQTARENGSHGGNPSLRKRARNPVSDNQNPTDDPTDPPGARARINHLPYASSPEENPPTPQGVFSAIFEAAWLAYPERGRGNLSKAKAWEAWCAAVLVIGSEDALLAAVQAYAYSAYVLTGGKPRRFDRWLADGAYDAHAQGKPSAAWPGPTEVRTAVALEKGEDWTAGYLDRCRWRDVPRRAVISENGFVVDTLKREVGHLFEAMEIGVLQENAA